MATYIKEVINQYEIGSKLGYFMLDNAESNDTCLETLASWFPMDVSSRRLRCIGHIINLVVRAVIFGSNVSKFEAELRGATDEFSFDIWAKKGSIGRLHNLATYIRRTDQRRQALRRLQAELAGDDAIFTLEIVVDGKTRWNSIYLMIERALELRSAIELYQSRWQRPRHDPGHRDLSKDFLTAADWVELERFCDFLKPFYILTKTMEGNASTSGAEGGHGAVWETLKTMDYLFVKFRQAAEETRFEDASHFKSGIDCGWAKLEDYYVKTDRTPVYRAALALHPSYGYDYFERHWKIAMDRPQWYSDMQSAVGSMFEEYARQAEVETQAQAGLVENESGDIDADTDDYSSFGKRSIRSLSTQRKMAKSVSELDLFQARPIYPTDLDVANPIEWWKQHQLEYPVLYQMALDLFSIPGMSAECERVFSQTKKMITDERNRLAPKTLILDFVDWPSLWDDLDYDSYEEDDRGIGIQNFFVNGMLGFSIPLVSSMARVINFDSLKSLTLRMYPGWDDFLTRVVQLKLPIKLKTLEIQGPDEGEGIEEPILRFLNAFQGLNELFLNQIALAHTLHIWSCIARRHAPLRRFVQHQRARDRSRLCSDEHDQPDLALWGLELSYSAENSSHNPIASFDLEFLGLSCVPEHLPSEATRNSPVSSHGTPSGDHRDQPPQTSPSQRTSTPDHATAERSAPPAETPKSVTTWPPPKALPNPRYHTTDQLNQLGDEYLPREVDKFGEKKVKANGQLLGGRRYRCRTFLVANRGDKLFMLATECAKKLGYRDSYLLFNKNRSLYKIVASQVEKDDLVQREILPFSYRSRHITIVTARSMFRQFGSRVIADGRRVRDDYWETLARKQGFTKADPAGEKRPGSKSRATAESRNKYLPSYPGTEVALSTATELPSLPDAPRSKPAGTTAAPPRNTAVMPGSAAASTYSSGAFSREWSSTANGTSSRQIIGLPYQNPAMDMISTAQEARVLPPELVGPAGSGDRIATAGRPHISAYTTASAAATQPLVTPPHPPQALRENPYPQSLQSHYYTNQPMWSQTLGHSTGTFATQYESVHRAQAPAFHLQQPRAGQDEPIMSFGRQYGSSYGMYLVNQTPGGHAPHTGPD
ncbi:transposase-like protein [Purpureocillium lavendulum]|uniref:Transposase-like protein n=1 Tax=Purpureocillium lavendulum TaxID=1247861 RepID=A0AB34FGW3_9HYPO|nr:transposase-like protein [Purpureocillium lavendulum]